MGGVHEILDYMTGDALFTHQLPRACDECGPPLLEQHPQLADIPIPDFGTGERADIEWRVIAWLADLATQHGERLPVTPLSAEQHTRIDPISEIRMMRPDIPIIVIAPPEQ
jgi:hypothetical protein